MKIVRNICRILLGLVFIFSGLVKAVDPLGSQYKFTDYFLAFHMDWLIPGALVFGFILFTIEFFLGFVLLFNIKLKQFSWLLLLFMIFFFALTLVLAITNWVTDCGCFGDAIKMSNWATFIKNVILMVPVLVVFFGRKKFVNKVHGVWQLLISLVGLGIVIGIGMYSLRHLPLNAGFYDFIPQWKKGAYLKEQLVPQEEIAEITLIYRNKETGETLEYTTKTLPWKDTVFFKKLEFVDQAKKVIREYREAPIHDFILEGEDTLSHNKEVIGNPDWQFMLVCYDLEKTERGIFPEINKLAEACRKDSISFVALSGSDRQSIDYFRHEVKADFTFYTVDATALKAVVRSNPGLVLLKDGVVVDKWAWRDIPDYATFKAKQPEYLELVGKVKAAHPEPKKGN